MQLGIFAKTFPGTTPDSVLSQVTKAGYATAHYNMACSGLAAMPDSISDEVAHAVAEAASHHAVNIVGLSATWNMIHPDPSLREQGLARLAVLGANAKAMGTRLVTLCTGTRDAEDQWRFHPDNAKPEAWAVLTHSMAKALTIAEQFDLILGIEPELANVISDAKAARRLLDEMKTDRLGIVLDPANLFEVANREERHRLVEEAVEHLGPHIVMAHAKDRDATGAFVAAGSGVIDFSHFIATLRKGGFKGPLVTHGLSADEAPTTASFLSRLLAEQGEA